MTILDSASTRALSLLAILWILAQWLVALAGVVMTIWLAVMLVSSLAKAQDGDEWRWVTKRVAHRSCDWAECRTYYTYVRVRQYAPRVYGYVRREDEWRQTDRRDYSPHCLSPVRVVDAEHNTEDGAMADVQRQWAAVVRHDSGERYMNLDAAREVATVCDRSSTNESWTGKIVEGVGKRVGGEDSAPYRKRCVLIATPCRAQLVRDDERRR